MLKNKAIERNVLADRAIQAYADAIANLTGVVMPPPPKGKVWRDKIAREVALKENTAQFLEALLAHLEGKSKAKTPTKRKSKAKAE